MPNPRLLAALAVCAVLLAGCAKAKPEEEAVDKAATVVPIPGTDRVRVRLTPEAVKRLDVQTGIVSDQAVAPRPTAPAPAPAGAGPAAVGAPVGENGPAAAPTPPPKAPAPAPAPLPGPTVRRVIPFAAVLYAPSGSAFTYVNVEPEVYERTPITIEYVVGQLAVMTAGPPLGTAVVTVGGPELSGAEFGVGE